MCSFQSETNMPREIADKFYVDDASVVRVTENAILVSAEIFDKDEWIPRSQIDEDSEVCDDTDDACGPGRLVVPLWLAEKRGWA